MKYAYVYIIILLTGIVFLNCNNKQPEFTQKQFKEIFRSCLGDPILKRRMLLGVNHRSINYWILNGNFKINDSIIIGHRKYLFKVGNAFIHNDSTILYKISYPGKNLSHLSLKYAPGKSYSILGEFDFKFEDENWKIIKRNSGIEDYKIVD